MKWSENISNLAIQPRLLRLLTFFPYKEGFAVRKNRNKEDNAKSAFRILDSFPGAFQPILNSLCYIYIEWSNGSFAFLLGERILPSPSVHLSGENDPGNGGRAPISLKRVDALEHHPPAPAAPSTH